MWVTDRVLSGVEAWFQARLTLGVTTLLRSVSSLCGAPSGDALVIPLEEDVGHFTASPNAGAGVVLVVHGLTVSEGILQGRARVTEDTGHESCGGFDDGQGREFPAREDEVSDGHGFRVELFVDTRVEAFIATAHQQGARFVREGLCVGLTEGATGRVEDQASVWTAALLEPFDAFDDGFGLQHHAGSTAEGAVVHGAVAVTCPIPEVHAVHVEQPFVKGGSDDTDVEVGLECVRE
jgi:hypothetical protein